MEDEKLLEALIETLDKKREEDWSMYSAANYDYFRTYLDLNGERYTISVKKKSGFFREYALDVDNITSGEGPLTHFEGSAVEKFYKELNKRDTEYRERKKLEVERKAKELEVAEKEKQAKLLLEKESLREESRKSEEEKRKNMVKKLKDSLGV